jgi:hypothetical protein
LASVCVVREISVLVSVTVITALAITLPDGSFTTPEMLPPTLAQSIVDDKA